MDGKPACEKRVLRLKVAKDALITLERGDPDLCESAWMPSPQKITTADQVVLAPVYSKWRNYVADHCRQTNYDQHFASVAPILGQDFVAMLDVACMCGAGNVNAGNCGELGISTDQFSAAIQFGKRYATFRERVISALQNVVAHDGDFVPA